MKKIYKQLLLSVFVAGSWSSIHAQTKMEYTPEQMKAMVAKQEARVDTLSKQFFALNDQIEDQIKKVVTQVASYSDSVDSKTRVARLKQMLVNDLMTSMKSLQQIRSKNQQDLPNLPSYSQPGAELEGKVLDAKLKERLDLIMDLSASLYQHKDVKRYNQQIRGDGNDVWVSNKVNKEYDLNIKNTTNTKQTKDDILKQMNALKFRLTQKVGYMEAEDKRAIGTPLATRYQDEIASKKKMIALLDEKMDEVKNGPEKPTESIGTLADAMQLENEVNTAMQKLRTENDELRQKGLELERAMSRLNDQREVLAKATASE